MTFEIQGGEKKKRRKQKQYLTNYPNTKTLYTVR